MGTRQENRELGLLLASSIMVALVIVQIIDGLIYKFSMRHVVIENTFTIPFIGIRLLSVCAVGLFLYSFKRVDNHKFSKVNVNGVLVLYFFVINIVFLTSQYAWFPVSIILAIVAMLRLRKR